LGWMATRGVSGCESLRYTLCVPGLDGGCIATDLDLRKCIKNCLVLLVVLGLIYESSVCTVCVCDGVVCWEFCECGYLENASWDVSVQGAVYL